MIRAAGAGALRRLAAALLFAPAWAAAAAGAQNGAATAHAAPAPAQHHVKIAFVQVDGDARYAPIVASDRIVLKKPDHPFAGAQVSIDDAAPLMRILKTDFALERLSVGSPAAVAPAVKQAADAGTHFFLVDASAQAYQPLAAVMHGRDVLLFQRFGAGRCAEAAALRPPIRSRLSKPRPAHGWPGPIRGVAQVDQSVGISRPDPGRRGHDGGIRAFRQ